LPAFVLVAMTSVMVAAPAGRFCRPSASAVPPA
jgi:hypothetical protein